MMTEKAYIKIVILAVYNAIGAEVGEADVQESIISTGALNAFDYSESFAELVADGLLAAGRDEQKLVCKITELGVTRLGDASLLIKKDTLDDIVVRAVRHFEGIITGKWYDATLEETDGGWCVSFSQKSTERDIILSKMFFENKNDAYAAYMHCKSKPESVHNGISCVMTGEIMKLIGI